MVRRRFVCFGIAGSFLAFAHAHAHHSYSEYDNTQLAEIEGTLVAVALQNPHSYFTVRGAGENGEVVTWSLESNTRNWFQRVNLPLELLEIGRPVKFAGWPSKRSSDRMYALNMLVAGQEILLFRDARKRWADAALGFGTQEAQSFFQGGVADGTAGLFRVWASDLDDQSGVLRPTAPLALTEQAKKAVEAFDPINDSTEKGCTPKGVPRLMGQPPPMQFIDRGDTIALRMEEYDTVRTIHMTASANPEAQPRTLLGYSVGRWDGKALVVETSRVDSPYLNAAGVPLGPDARFLERFEPTADGSRLNYTLTITDPYSLAAPAELKRFWVSRPGEQVLPFNCTEAPAARSQPSSGFRVTNVRVFDGERVHQRTNVVVETGIIRALDGDVSTWRDLPAIDGSGATLLPGLIDAHVHVRDAEQLRQALRFGVTTALDLGAIIEPEPLLALRTASKAASDMAELRVAGVLASARGPEEPNPLTTTSTPQVATVQDARQFVAMRHAENVDHLKIVLRGVQSAANGVPNLDETRVRALVEAAHANDLVVVAHVETLDDVRIALAGGVDGVVHVWRREGASPETARRVVEHGAFVMPVIVAPDSFVPDTRAVLLAEPRFQGVLSDAIKEQLAVDNSYPRIRANATPIEARRASVETQLAAVRSLREAGTKFIAGSDASHVSPIAFGISFHRELELLTKVGLTSTEVLAAATSSTADAFRLHDRGRVAVGLRADLLLVRGDPTADILATRDIVKVWKAGVEVDREK